MGSMMEGNCTICGLPHAANTACSVLPALIAQPQEALVPDASVAGRFRILRLLHEGAMSAVYQAQDVTLQRMVALKELRAPAGSDQEAREAMLWFMRESHLLSTLSHPLIPVFYSSFHDQGRNFIVQEYVEGLTLEALVAERGPLDPLVVTRWGLALCDLLGYLHRLEPPVVFRDLKPANILLRPNGTLAVVDFGIARPYLDGEVGTTIGTPGYAPPEQYQGLATPLSDLYALGATLHRLLTAYDPEHERPFVFPSADELNPAVPHALADVLIRALRIAPQERFASATEMHAALRDAMPGAALVPRSAIGALGLALPAAALPFIGSLIVAGLLGVSLGHTWGLAPRPDWSNAVPGPSLVTTTSSSNGGSASFYWQSDQGSSIVWQSGMWQVESPSGRVWHFGEWSRQSSP
jgi:serine/threonine protein kinase